MKKPMVDYREFRFSRLNTPQFSHVWLLAGWLVYFALYFLTENLIPAEACHVVHCALDDVIPFHEFFAIFYCYWYVYLVGSLLYFFLYDVVSFKRLQVFLIFTQLSAMLVYILWPSVQHLRPETFARDNLLTRLMAFIYAFDTPTGVCPSLHVAYSVGIACVWCSRKPTSRGMKAFVIVSAVLISISTAFVKQHSVVDILAALLQSALAAYVVYGKFPGGKTRLQRWIERGPQG